MTFEIIRIGLPLALLIALGVLWFKLRAPLPDDDYPSENGDGEDP